MNISNLKFFDKNGESYNFELVTDSTGTYWYGADYFQPVSTALYDVSNIFILEETNGVHHFPNIGTGGTLVANWKKRKDFENFFLFTVSKTSDGTAFLDKKDSLEISSVEMGFDSIVSNFESVKYPMQLNVAFTPNEERSFQRELEIWWKPNGNQPSQKLAEIGFYGEGEDEDERFRVWLQNFGVKFNREDAEILRNYNLKESLPNWKDVNLARKELLVNRDQIYPYVGTYKGLINLVNILGYRDVLKVKEYWQNSESTSPYFQKYAQVDITDMLDNGVIDNLDLTNLNSQIKQSAKFKKTEFLALVYEFSQASDKFDDDGLPEVEFTTEFSTDEIFHKLNLMAKKLKNEILPINVIIKDIIGEFIYFEKFNIRYWSDRTDIVANTVNEEFTAIITQPDTVAQELVIRDIKSLFHKENLTSPFPFITFNASLIQPFEDAQKYDTAEVPKFITAIKDFYQNERYYEYAGHSQVDPSKTGDDAHGQTGCPIVLEASIDDLTLQDLDGSTWTEFREWKSFARCATTTNLTALTGLLVVDGVELENDDRILVKNQTNAQQNGIYVVNESGWYRTNDFVPYSGTLGAVLFIDEGAVNANTAWYSTDNIFGSAGSINIAFAAYTAETADSKKSHHTIGTLKYRDSFETEWTITGPNNYYFNVRGTTINYAKWPHILPYVGTYDVELKMYDLSGGISLDYIHPTVVTEDPVITLFMKVEDKFNYQFRNLSNVTIEDFGQTSIYNAGVNVLDPDPGSLTLESHYFDMFTYINDFGLGSNVKRVEIYNNGAWENIITSALPQSKQWGLGKNNANLTIGDLGNAQLGDLYHTRFFNAMYPSDYLNGFVLDTTDLNSIKYGGFPTIPISPVQLSSALGFAAYMNGLTQPGWSNYTYVAIDATKVRASAKQIDRQNHAILQVVNNGVTSYISTFQYPVRGYSEEVMTWLETEFPLFNRDSLFLEMPFEDSIQGLGLTTNYWINKGFIEYTSTTQRGFLPSNFDQDAFDLIGVKISDDTMKVPTEMPVFAVFANIDSKTETVWTLYDSTKTEIARVKTTAYFTWRFNKPGKYYISSETTDKWGNVFNTPNPQLFVEVLDREDYVRFVENELNRRKLGLLK